MKPKKRAPRLHPLHPERGATHPRSFVFGATRCLVEDHDVDFTRTPDLPKNQVCLVFCNAFLGHIDMSWSVWIFMNFCDLFCWNIQKRRWLLSWVMPYASEAPNIYRVLCIQWYCWIPSNVVSILDVNKKCAKFLRTNGISIAPSCKRVAITRWMRESRCTAWIFQVFARWSWVPPRTPMVLRSFYQTLDVETMLFFLSCSFSVEPIFFGIHKWYSLRTRLNRSNHWFRGGPWKFKPRGQRFATAGRVATTSRWAAGTMAQFIYSIPYLTHQDPNWVRELISAIVCFLGCGFALPAGFQLSPGVVPGSWPHLCPPPIPFPLSRWLSRRYHVK